MDRTERRVASQDWHPKQKGEVDKDGSYCLSLPYADDRELVMDILKYGPDVEVLEPEALRKRVADQLGAAVKLYRYRRRNRRKARRYRAAVFAVFREPA